MWKETHPLWQPFVYTYKDSVWPRRPVVKISTGQATTADRCPNHCAGCPWSLSPTFQAGFHANKKNALEKESIWVYICICRHIIFAYIYIYTHIYIYMYNVWICLWRLLPYYQVSKIEKKLQQASKSFNSSKKVVCGFCKNGSSNIMSIPLTSAKHQKSPRFPGLRTPRSPRPPARRKDSNLMEACNALADPKVFKFGEKIRVEMHFWGFSSKFKVEIVLHVSWISCILGICWKCPK